MKKDRQKNEVEGRREGRNTRCVPACLLLVALIVTHNKEKLQQQLQQNAAHPQKDFFTDDETSHPIHSLWGAARSPLTTAAHVHQIPR